MVSVLSVGGALQTARNRYEDRAGLLIKQNSGSDSDHECHFELRNHWRRVVCMALFNWGRSDLRIESGDNKSWEIRGWWRPGDGGGGSQWSTALSNSLTYFTSARGGGHIWAFDLTRDEHNNWWSGEAVYMSTGDGSFFAGQIEGSNPNNDVAVVAKSTSGNIWSLTMVGYL